ncbi:twin-arginine translocase subunit TatC, partial [Enterobacter hormaechei subsp. steigerwaltii]|nr:twin-arginine translocase subunit TatC [Enterobacter hormaechei subsp. steigerwaltii]
VGVNMATDIDKYLSFILGMFVAFGTTFEVPIVVILLTKIGVVTTEQLKRSRPYVIVGAFVIAAVITRPYVIARTLLAIPLILLYEAGIWFGRFFTPRSEQDGDIRPPATT